MNLLSNIPIRQRAEQARMAREYAGASPVLRMLWRRVETERLARSNTLLVRRAERAIRGAK